MITVCFIENIDAMGVHTGDSFCSAPMLTISEDLQRKLQNWSYKIVEAIQVIGGTNVQFAHDPKTDRVVIIEINPRTSRSSALASKATGFPIARVSTLLAAGLTLDEIPYWRCGTLDKYSPYGDYVVIKFARWAFEKFKGSVDKLGTQMRAVGEVMSIGKNYKEAFQKSIRSLETGRHGLGFAKNFNSLPLKDLMGMLAEPSSERQFIIYEAIRKGASVDELQKLTHIKKWFLEQMKELVELEEEIISKKGKKLPDNLLIKAKKDGFSDKYLAKILELKEKDIREQRKKIGINEGWHPVRVSGVDNAAYYYSTYNASDESKSDDKAKVMILGGGPNRIGQGIEFDYCCCHAAFALREMGFGTIMVNCNPETVSTDYDTSDKLYFEPLTVEDVLSIYEKEKPIGAIVQFGGQTPLNIAAELKDAGVKILGTSVETIALAEDRDLFRKMMDKLKIPMPESGMASTVEEAVEIAGKIGYPVMVRPSFVLGGRGMEVVYDEGSLRAYVGAAVDLSPDRPILVDRFLQDALEVETDAISDGKEVFIPAIMEHIEFAGVHSGDSACVIPPVSIPEKHKKTISDYSKKIATELRVSGLMNIQFAIENDKVYVLEANPRASRTVPLVSKVCGIQMASAATKIMMGKKLNELGLRHKKFSHFGVKESVFPFNMYPEVDPLLGPEMRSTGEVLGIADSFPMAYFKAEEAAKPVLPTEGTVLISTPEKTGMLESIGKEFQKLGFKILSTGGTHDFLASKGVKSEVILKLHEGRPNINDAIANKQISLVVNTPIGKRGYTDDSYIRKAAIKHKIPYITTLPAALAAAKGIAAYKKGKAGVTSLQEYQKNFKEDL